jgi:hypothetical protein
MFENFKTVIEKKYPGTSVIGVSGKKTKRGSFEAYIMTRKGVRIEFHSKLYGDGGIDEANMDDVLEKIEEKLHYYVYRKDEIYEEDIYDKANQSSEWDAFA